MNKNITMNNRVQYVSPGHMEISANYTSASVSVKRSYLILVLDSSMRPLSTLHRSTSFVLIRAHHRPFVSFPSSSHHGATSIRRATTLISRFSTQVTLISLPQPLAAFTGVAGLSLYLPPSIV